jgi:ABC-2 type transport system ATP-binding protein
MSTVVETQELTRRFGRSEAISELSLKVNEGSIYAFLGPNGAGKTTTIKVLMNLLEPSAGRANVLGVPSTKLRPAELGQIGYVSENQELPTWMTASDLFAFCKPLYPQWDGALCSELLRRFDLPPRQKIRSFSRGMKMKTALIASLAYHPRLLILDEPLGGLDPLVRDEIVEGMLELVGKGDWSVFISSHDLSEIEHLADHVGFIREGRLIVSEDAATLKQRFREIEVTLTEPRPLPSPWPADWLTPAPSGRVIRFVDSRYDEGVTTQRLKQMFSEEVGISASPIALRDIFIALARRTPVAGGRI